jgi:hypothetical protein
MSAANTGSMAAEIAEAGDKKISLQIMSCFYNVHSYWNTVRLEQ